MKLTKQKLKQLAKMLQQAYENQQLVVGVHGRTDDQINVGIISDMKIMDMSMFKDGAATVDIMLHPETFSSLRGMVQRREDIRWSEPPNDSISGTRPETARENTAEPGAALLTATGSARG